MDVPDHRQRRVHAHPEAPPPAHRGARRLRRAVEERLESLPGPAAESSEALERVSHAIETLPVKLRHVVLLKDVYGLSHEDIAAELDISVAAAKVRLHRGRRKLKDMLYEQGEEAHAV